MRPLRWAALRIVRLFSRIVSIASNTAVVAGPNRRSGRSRPQAPLSKQPAYPARLSEAYRILGLTPAASEELVRAAYRRLMSRSHPDKLVAGGATELELKAALQNTYEIRKAYDLIRRLAR